VTKWFAKFFPYEKINPGLELLFDNFDIIQEEFRENLPRLSWREWGYQAGYTGHNKIAYDGWEVAGLYGEYDGYLDGGDEEYDTLWDDQSSFYRRQHKPGTENNAIPEFYHQVKWTGDLSNLPESKGPEYLYTNTDLKLVFTDNCHTMPKLTKLLYDSGVRRRVGISVTHPGRGIGWHADQDPERMDEMVIRGIIGLDVRVEEGEQCYLGLGTPNNELKFHIRDNKSSFFYSRVPHHVVNELKYPRYCIILDHSLPKKSVRNK